MFTNIEEGAKGLSKSIRSRNSVEGGIDPSPKVRESPLKGKVISSWISLVDKESALTIIGRWVSQRRPRAIFAVNVHMVMEARDDSHFQEMVNEADMATADGMPVAWMLKKVGYEHACRLTGPELTREVLALGSAERWKIGLFGAKPETLANLRAKIEADYAGVQISFTESPPFRDLTEDENEDICRRIRESQTQLLFVCLGCPKQEKWIAANKCQLDCVAIGVGAAFAFLTGETRHAPAWIQNCGMEWLFRLATEPRRLWKRYAKHNPRFIWLGGMQLLRFRLQKKPPEMR